MKVSVVTVIPLSLGLPKDHLNYFTTKEISLGSIVEVPLRKQTIKALVVGIEDASKQKAELKDAEFSLRPIKTNLGPSPFSQSFFKTLFLSQNYFLGNLSQIFSNSVPQVLIEHILDLPRTAENQERVKKSFTQEKLIFQNSWKERINFYKTYIRESFARGESVRFFVPTIQEANLLEAEIQKGIQEFVLVFHSKKTEKKILEQWNTVISSSHPLCIIHTPQFLCLPREDCGTYILEFESSPHYRQNKKPYIDGRVLVEFFARINNTKLIVADSLLRTETLTRHKNQEFGTLGNLVFRIDSEAEHCIIDMRKTKLSNPIVSDIVMQEIENYYKAGKKIVLFALRSGLATTTICNDCGTTVTHKGIPLTLHTDPKTGVRFFKSRKHNEVFRSNIVCSVCKSWNLVPLGVGTEKIEEILKEKNPSYKIIRLDQNQNNTTKQQKESIQKFYNETNGSILITSPLGIQHLQKNVDMTCIVSLDTLFNIPQYNMYETIMQSIMNLSTRTSDKLYIQTRYGDQKIISIIENKKLLNFFEYDYQERKEWLYPPFSTLIKMTYQGPTTEKLLLEKYIKKTFKDTEFFLYHTKGFQDSKTITHIILKLKNELWPLPWNNSNNEEKTKEIQEKLKLFPESWSIIVNPHNLF